MKRKIIIIPAIVAAVLIALFLGKNVLIKTSVSAGVKAMTGLTLSIGSMNVGVFKSLIGINELRLHNPPGYQDELMVNIPEIYVDYDLGSFIGGKAHLEEIRLNLKEFLVVKNEAGELNLNALKVVKGKEEEKAGEGQKGETKMPELQIDVLKLKISRVIYKDYSKGTPPKVKEFNVNVDEQYENITDPYAFGRLIVIKALSKTTIASLANFDVEKLKAEVAGAVKERVEETVKETTEKVQEAADRALEAQRGIEEKARETVSETAKEKVEEVTDKIKKILPFGKK